MGNFLCTLPCKDPSILLLFWFFCQSKISFKCISWKSTRCVVIHKQSNDKRIKVNEDQDLFCGVSEKSGFKWLHKESFESFLELLGRERSASINCFFYKSLILLSLWSRSVEYARFQNNYVWNDNSFISHGNCERFWFYCALSAFEQHSGFRALRTIFSGNKVTPTSQVRSCAYAYGADGLFSVIIADTICLLRMIWDVSPMLITVL